MDDTTTLPYIISLVEEGAIRPCIDRIFDIDDLQKAHTYVERGHSKGKVVVRGFIEMESQEMEAV